VEQITQVGNSYERLYGNSLEKAIKSEFSGNSETALVYLLCDPIDIYCRKIQNATIGQMGTDESLVCRVIAGNERSVVREIAARYFQKYDRTLVGDLQKELSGLFSLAVVTYIEANNSSFEVPTEKDAQKEVPMNLPPPPQAPVKEVKAATMAPPPPPPQVENKPVYMESKPTYSEVATLTTTNKAPVEPQKQNDKYPVGSDGIPEMMRGWATKEGHFIRNWKRRHFVLISNKTATIIRYYEEETNDPPFYGQNEKGEINIRNYNVSLIDGDTVYLKGKYEEDKDLKMKIDSPAERSKWMEALRAHIDYRTAQDNGQRAKQLGDL
jgi:hypothetical protein